MRSLGRAHGWPAPIRAMSGNGGHSVYRIDLPNTAAARDLIRGCLTALARRYSDDQSVLRAPGHESSGRPTAN